jgi:hypothetical protein
MWYNHAQTYPDIVLNIHGPPGETQTLVAKKPYRSNEGSQNAGAFSMAVHNEAESAPQWNVGGNMSQQWISPRQRRWLRDRTCWRDNGAKATRDPVDRQDAKVACHNISFAIAWRQRSAMLRSAPRMVCLLRSFGRSKQSGSCAAR